MKTGTFILRLRFGDDEFSGAVEDPLTGMRVTFASLDDLGVKLREVQNEWRLRESGPPTDLLEPGAPEIHP